MIILHQWQPVSTGNLLQMWKLVHKIFVGLTMPNLEVLKMPKIWLRQIGILSPTKILGTKIHIYKRFPVDTGGHWCKIITLNMPNLSLKIFRRSTVIKLVLEFQIKFGAPKPWSISFFWPFSIYTWNLAPENALGAKHFSHGVILGQPNPFLHFNLSTNFQPF